MTRAFAAWKCVQTDFPGSRLRTKIGNDKEESAFGYRGDIASDNMSAPQSRTPPNVAEATALSPESGLEITAGPAC